MIRMMKQMMMNQAATEIPLPNILCTFVQCMKCIIARDRMFFFFRWMFQPANMLDILRWPTSLGETQLDSARRVWAANLCGAKSKRSMVNRRLPPISRSLPKIGKLGNGDNPAKRWLRIRGHDETKRCMGV